MKNCTYIFTGGGSGGHTIPAKTLIDELQRKLQNSETKNFKVVYFGSKSGVESLVFKGKVDRYVPISVGKLRRSRSLKGLANNFIDLFKFSLGVLQSYFALLAYSQKSLVFSTGGFVSLPVVLAAKLQRKRVFIHEQTTRVGLANKIASYFANQVFISFSDSKRYFPRKKTKLSGYPIRSSFFEPAKPLKFVEKFDPQKPLVFITGGGNGSLCLNNWILSDLEKLKQEFCLVHQVGKIHYEEFKNYQSASYLPLAFLGDEMVDLLKVSNVVVSRAGAGTVCELLALKKPSLFVPLKGAQKNEQYHNAQVAEKLLGSWILQEEELGDKTPYNTISQFIKTRTSEVKLQAEAVGSDAQAVSNGLSFLTQELLKAQNLK